MVPNIGAIAGGLVGGFSGFVTNSFHEGHQFRRARQNVACALVGEIDALSAMTKHREFLSKPLGKWSHFA